MGRQTLKSRFVKDIPHELKSLPTATNTLLRLYCFTDQPSTPKQRLTLAAGFPKRYHLDLWPPGSDRIQWL